MGFSLPGFLAENREPIIAEWLQRLQTEVGEQYAQRPRSELIATITQAYDANLAVLKNNDFGPINQFIDQITRMRLDAGFLLSHVQMAFELFRSICVPRLARVTTVAQFETATLTINRCLTYTIHRFSDQFQAMQQAMIVANNQQLTEAVRQRTAALKESEQRYKVLVEEINDGYFVLQDRRVVFANPAFCKMHGYPLEEVLNQPFTRFIDPESRAQVVARYEKSLRRHYTPRTLEYLRLTRRGQSYPTEILTKNTTYQKRLSSIGICRDITERVQMEKKMRESERMAYIGQIATSLSHEIRNPLSSVQMNLQILKKNDKIQGNDRRRIDISIQEVKRLEQGLKAQLDYAKPIQLRFSNESLNRIVSTAMELMEIRFAEKGTQLVAHLDLLEPTVYADREKLGQALINLLLNALEATEPSGQVVVETRLLYQKGRRVEIHVSDDGCGLPAAQPEEIFKPFFTTKSRGTGLGLSNVLRIVNAHQGTIRAENRHPHGAVFTMVLPVYRNQS